ncbi:MAG TPA: hypothetical protein VFU12_15105 [Glycomyces sp.]|nr:hypothetical protein [Glycomyces sp.]
MPTEQPILAYHYRQMLLGDITGQASACQFPEPVDPPKVGDDLYALVYLCARCGMALHVNGGNVNQPEPITAVYVICGHCNYPDFVRDLAFPEDLCPCFGWVYLNED